MTESSPVTAVDFVYAFALSPSFAEDGTCFMARASGLYRSTDRGKTWQLVSLANGAKYSAQATAIALSPQFAADRTVFAGASGAIARSVDAGDTWELFRLAAPPPMILSLDLSPRFMSDGIVFAATIDDGVLRSDDRGRSWSGLNLGLFDRTIHCLAVSPDFTTDECLIVGTESGIAVTDNGGRLWRHVNLPSGTTTITSIAFSRAFSQDRTVWLGTDDGTILRLNPDDMTARALAHRLGERVQMIIAGGTSDQQILGVLETSIMVVDTVQVDAKPTVLFDAGTLQVISTAVQDVGESQVTIVVATDDGVVHTVVHHT